MAAEQRSAERERIRMLSTNIGGREVPGCRQQLKRDAADMLMAGSIECPGRGGAEEVIEGKKVWSEARAMESATRDWERNQLRTCFQLDAANTTNGT